MSFDMIDELAAVDRLQIRAAADALLDELFDLHRREVAA